MRRPLSILAAGFLLAGGSSCKEQLEPLGLCEQAARASGVCEITTIAQDRRRVVRIVEIQKVTTTQKCQGEDGQVHENIPQLVPEPRHVIVDFTSPDVD